MAGRAEDFGFKEVWDPERREYVWKTPGAIKLQEQWAAQASAPAYHHHLKGAAAYGKHLFSRARQHVAEAGRKAILAGASRLERATKRAKKKSKTKRSR